MIEPTRPRRTTWHTLAVGILAIVWQLAFFDRWLSPMDEGHMLAFADMLSKGGELYRDASLLPLPGAFYLLELAFELFGPSIRLTRFIVVLEFALLAVIAFSLLRRLVPLGVAWAGVVALLLYRIWVFPHWHMYSYSTTALVALAVALLALVKFLETDRRWVLAWAGLATGLGVLCKQDYGAAGWVAMNAVLVVSILSSQGAEQPKRWQILAWYNLPVLAVGAATALHFLRQGLFLEMLRQTFLNHLIGIATFEYTSRPPILPLFEQEPLLRGRLGYTVYAPSILATVDWERITSTAFFRDTFLWDLGIKLCFHLPYVVACVAALRMWRLRHRLADVALRKTYLTELALSVYAILLLAALTKPVDWLHLMVLCWPLLCLVIVQLHALVAGRGWPVRAALALGLLPGIALGAYTVELAWRLRAQFPTRVGLERAGVYTRPNEARVIREVVEYVRAHSEPGEPFAVLPYFPLISFLADRPAPHRAAYVLWPVEDVPHRQQEIIQALETNDSQHLIYHLTQWVQFPRMEEFAPDLFAYLVDHYEIDRVFRGPCWVFETVGLRRSVRPAAGRAVMLPHGADVELRIERTGQAPQSVPEAERSRFVGTERWPFRDVLALQPITCGDRVVLAAPVEVPSGGRLQTAIAVDPSHWCAEDSPPLTFSMWAAVEEERVLLYSRTLHPLRRPLDRGWFEVDVSLATLAGRHVEIELATECGQSRGLSRMGAWEIPRIVTENEKDRGER